jgi:hypothetical protein
VNKRLPIFVGGLLRCCIDTWDAYDGPSDEGTVLQCRYNPGPDHRLVSERGSWRWVNIKEEEVPPLGNMRAVSKERW